MSGFSQSASQISPWQPGHSGGERNGKTFIFPAFHCEERRRGRMQGEREVLKSERVSECVGEPVTINV